MTDHYMFEPGWIQSIRDRDFLLTYADVPLEHHNQLNSIHEKLKQDAWELTKILFPGSTQDEFGWIEIGNDMVTVLSAWWWELVEQKLAEGGVR